jgi:hypothetical protein
MNDFTSEELEELHYLIDERQSVHGEYGKNNLGDKIKDMINNYCAHIPEIKSSDDSPLFVGCQFCDKVFYDE